MVKLDFLVGTWKMEDKETYEVWEKEGNTFKGHVYKLIKGEKHITETLEIKFIEGNIIYSPTVPDQNDGKAIPFRHNRSIKDLISFENKAHDFPKKIQYKVISDTRIHISVLGEDEEGFSYYMVKQ
jgi:hypothetical protein